ncbi:hypothetical protein ACKR6V_002009 [Morganella morganii]|uniref:hypothetical protein n=1 Tax=Morganella morganii TaxID=582 RepID=UPI001FFC6223|nr:hypothetical protein [Morganella morganii]
MKPQLLIKFIRDVYQSNDFIPLHAPTFNGNEKNMLPKQLIALLFQVSGNLLMILKEK